MSQIELSKSQLHRYNLSTLTCKNASLNLPCHIAYVHEMRNVNWEKIIQKLFEYKKSGFALMLFPCNVLPFA